MKQAKDTNNPSNSNVPDTLKQHYAGTGVAKRNITNKGKGQPINADNNPEDT